MRTNWIDGAKGIAMLMVIAVHFAQSFSFLPGFYGLADIPMKYLSCISLQYG